MQISWAAAMLQSTAVPPIGCPQDLCIFCPVWTKHNAQQSILAYCLSACLTLDTILITLSGNCFWFNHFNHSLSVLQSPWLTISYSCYSYEMNSANDHSALPDQNEQRELYGQAKCDEWQHNNKHFVLAPSDTEACSPNHRAGMD